MSYIDTFDHELVGLFGGIPVYHPLVTVKGAFEDYEFGCSPDHLIIGGGSGERPAVLIIRPDIAVAHFVNEWMVRLTPDEDKELAAVRNKSAAAGSSYAVWNSFIEPRLLEPIRAFIRYAGWGADDCYDFLSMCRSNLLHTPYEKSKDACFETWLASCMGEFIFYSMPNLISDLEMKLPGARSCLTTPIFHNVLIPPPG